MSSCLFTDRREAAAQLARALGRYRRSNPLVFALAGGGFEIGRIIAARLRGELELLTLRESDAGTGVILANTVLDTGSADPSGRTVIVVDDGCATWSTLIAALRALRTQAPARLICAVPLACADGLEQVPRYADDIVCLAVPTPFGAAEQYYLHLEPAARDGAPLPH